MAEGFGDYFDLKDIIATNQKVQCRLEITMPKLGYLDKSSKSSDLAKHTKLELPCWLSQTLVAQQRSAIRIETPKLFAENYRQILEVDPEVVDLHKLCPFFYSFGLHLLKFSSSDMLEMSDFLIKTYIARVAWLLDNCMHNSEEKPGNLDKLESELYDIGRQSQEDFLSWLHRCSEQVAAKKSNERSKKRKWRDANL